MDTNEARKAIEQEKAERMKRCMDRMSAILQEERCKIVAVPSIVDGKIIAQAQVIAED